MAVRIRLRRMGTRKKPFYRIVVADSREARDGRFIEIVGYFDPTTQPPTMKVEQERVQLWLDRGAKPSDTTAAILKKQGMLGGKPQEEKAEEPKKVKAPARKKAQAAAEAAAAAAEAPAEASAEVEAPAAEAKETPAEEAKPEAEVDTKPEK